MIAPAWFGRSLWMPSCDHACRTWWWSRSHTNWSLGLNPICVSHWPSHLGKTIWPQSCSLNNGDGSVLLTELFGSYSKITPIHPPTHTYWHQTGQICLLSLGLWLLCVCYDLVPLRLVAFPHHINKLAVIQQCRVTSMTQKARIKI